MKFCLSLLTLAAGSLVSLEAARFPLTFRLCAYRLDGSNERFESVGYQDEERMFLGQSRFDDSKFGWAGHGVNMGVQEMLAATNFDWPSLISKIEYFDGKEGTEKYLRPILQQKIHGCITLDPNDYFPEMVEGGELFLTVNKTENLGLSVYIEDREVTVSRSLKSNSVAYTGAKVSLADLGQTWNKKYLLSLSQSQGVERSGCANYPSQEFSSYSHCDAAFLSQLSQDLNLTPFWAAANLSQVTRETADPGQEGRLLLWSLFDGSLESDCAKPCLTTSVRGSELAEWRTHNQHSTLAFSFAPTYHSSPSHCFS